MNWIRNWLRIKKINIACLLGFAVIGLFGVIHLADTKAGAYATGDTWLIGWYCMLLVACLFIVCAVGYLMFVKKDSNCRLEHIYLITGLFFGILYLLVLPPLSAPDEVSHYISSYKLSNQMMGKPVCDEQGRILVRSEDWFLEDVHGNYRWFAGEDGILYPEKGAKENTVLGQMLTEETYFLIHEKGLRNWEEARVGNDSGLAISAYSIVNTTPLAYAPQAAGITLARLLGLNSLGMVYMGRLFNLLFFVIATYLAMRKLPFGKPVLFGVAVLPMTLHLSASYSYDAMIMAGVFYFTAYCLDLAFKKEYVRWRNVAVLALLIAAVGPCKMVYAVVMGLCLLIPVRKFGSWKKYLLAAGLVLAAFAGAMLIVNSHTLTSYATGADNYVAWADSPGYSIGYLVHNPGRLFQVFYNTILTEGEYFYMSMLGSYLGNLDRILEVPFVVLSIFGLGLLLLAFRKPGENLKFTKVQTAWIWFLFLFCSGFVMFSMLVGWTPISSLTIAGIQGRYFLPLLPVFVMSLQNNFVVLSKDRDRMVLYVMCCANSYILLRLFSLVCMRV